MHTFCMEMCLSANHFSASWGYIQNNLSFPIDAKNVLLTMILKVKGKIKKNKLILSHIEKNK